MLFISTFTNDFFCLNDDCFNVNYFCVIINDDFVRINIYCFRISND